MVTRRKHPIIPRNRRIKSDNPVTLSHFALPVAAKGNFGGIGFFIDDTVSATDLDDCFYEESGSKQWLRMWINT